MIVTAWVIKALAGVILAGVVCCFWDAIRDSVASWLRNSKRENSWLMEALIQLDRVVGAARKTFKATIFVRGKRSRKYHVVDEYEQLVHEIDDEDVKAQLMKTRKKQETFDILEMVN